MSLPRWWWWLGVFAALGLAVGWGAQEKVLELDGIDSYVELPPGIFDQLSEATVEAWVKWDSAEALSRVFNYGERQHDLSVLAYGGHNLAVVVGDRQFRLQWLVASGVVKPGNWCHVAAVFGPQGTQVYFNGGLVATNDYPGSFSALGNGAKHYFGKSVSANDTDPPFHGQMDDVRIWKVARTGAQIQANLFARLTGREAGLVGLWHFDTGRAEDATSGRHHGELRGAARAVVSRRPSPGELLNPVFVRGRVLDEAGNAVRGARVVIEQDRQLVVATTSSEAGEFRLAVYPDAGSYDLAAMFDGDTAWKVDLPLSSQPQWNFELTLQRPPVGGRVQTLSEAGGIPNVVVQILEGGPRNRLAGTTLTDDQGRFEFKYLRPSEYRVRCQVPGGLVDYDHGALLRVDAQHRRQELEFRLAPFKKGNWKSYGSQDFLAHDEVHDLLVEPDGVMWFATAGGVSRFDGRKVTHFTREDGLAHNLVYVLARGEDATMWFGTEGGVSRLQNGQCQSYTVADGLVRNNIASICFDPKGEIWFGTGGGGIYDSGSGISVLSTNGGFRAITMTNGLPNDDVLAMLRDTDGTIWLGTHLGVAHYQGDRFVRWQPTNQVLNAGVHAIHRQSDGVLWFGAHDGAVRYDPKAGAQEGTGILTLTPQDGLPTNMVLAIHQDRRGRVWFGTDGSGAACLDRGSFAHYAKADGLAADRVFAIRETPDGALWFATSGGVSRHEDPGTLVNFSIRDGLPANPVAKLAAAPDGHVWMIRPVASDGFGLPNWSSRGYGVSAIDGTNVLNYTTSNGLSGNLVQALHCDTNGVVWLATETGVTRWEQGEFHKTELPRQYGGVLSILPESNGVVWLGTVNSILRADRSGVTDISKAQQLAAQSILAIHRARDGARWFATRENGVWREIEGRWTNYTVGHGLPKNWITSITESPDRSLWFTTGGSMSEPARGVARFDGRNFTTFTSTNGLSDNDVRCVLADLDGTVWFGTRSSGVCRYDAATASSRGQGWSSHTRARNQLAQNSVNAISRDRAGRLWFGTDGGVTCFDGTAWASFGLVDGLAGNRVLSITEDSLGRMWFGTENGVSRYQRSLTKPRPPAIEVRTDHEGERPTGAPIATTGRRVTFTFHSPADLKSRREQRQYRWRITRGAMLTAHPDSTAGWSEPTSTEQYETVFLQAGLYDFSVQYIDCDLNYSESASVTVRVEGPWYLNPWLQVLAGVALLGLLVYAAKRREARRFGEQMLRQEHEAKIVLEAKNKELAEINRLLQQAKEAADQANQSKSTFLASMSHELRTPLNAIIGYTEMLQDQATETEQVEVVQDLTKIHGASKHLLGLINDVLDLSKVEAGKMTLHLETFEIRRFVDDVAAIVQPLTATNHNRLELDCPTEIGSLHADLAKVRQTLFNLLSNACKFTSNGVITLRCRREGEPTGTPNSSNVTFQVIDTGIGITPAQMARLFQPFAQAESSTSSKYGGTGLGLLLCRKLCELMGGSIAVTSQPGIGTTFTVTLPAVVADRKAPAK